MCKRVIWWCLTIACGALILSFSLQSVKTSLEISGTVTDTLLQYDAEYQALPDSSKQTHNNQFHDDLRNVAHVVVFSIFGFCASMLVRTYTKKRWWMIALPACMAFAIVDEGVQFLQHSGRSFEISDIGRDWLGIGLGVAFAAVVSWIVINKEKRKHGVSGTGT